MSEQGQKKKDRLPYIMILFSAILIFGTVVAYFYFNGLDDNEAPVMDANDIKFTDGTNQTISTVISDNFLEIVSEEIVQKCDRYLVVSQQLLANNNGTADIGQWSEQDRNIVLQIENLYNEECVLDRSNAFVNMESCTATFITIQRLIDKMDERNRDTLSEEDNAQYEQSYLDYFNNYCNTLYAEIIQQPSFLEFNQTRNG